MAILKKAHLAAGRALPDPETLPILADTWAEIVAVVPLARLNDAYVWAMQNRDEHSGALLRPDELVRAWRQLAQAAVSNPPFFVAPPDPEDRPAPEEIAATCERLKGELEAKRGAGFARAGEVAAGTGPVRCEACGLDYSTTVSPRGCPRCRVREIAWRGVAASGPSVDAAEALDLLPGGDDDDR
jgi:predicted Zn-ribbon and HTH transcriptional regulator